MDGVNTKKASMRTYYSNIKLRENSNLDYFFKKILSPIARQFVHLEDEENTLTRAVSLFFNEGRREIITARTTSRFKMPGLYQYLAGRHIKGISAIVKKGTRLYIRMDADEPDRIDVQIVQKFDHLTGMPTFLLTQNEFKLLLSRIKVENY